MQYTEDVVQRFARLFRCREVTHGLYWPSPDGDPEKKRAKTVHEPVPDALWRSHLEGALPFLGSCPITQDNLCYWGAIDLDDDESDHVAIEARVRALKLPLVVCRSKSGGVHFFVFFSEPVSAKLLIDKLKEWRHALGITNTPDKFGKVRDIEVFPKQFNLKPSADGNWVNLPYWKAAETTRYAIKDGEPLSLEAFLAHAENMRVSEASLRAVHPSPPGASRRALPVVDTPFDPNDPFADGPPCLQTLHAQGWTEGSRNSSLYNIALFLRLKSPDGWKEDVLAFNQEHIQPPLPEGELGLLINSIDNHPDYVYRCTDVPIEPVCQKTICRKRAFGIKAFTEMRLERDFPDLTNLCKIETDPPLWQVDVDGTRVELSSEDLLFLGRFRKVVLEKKSIVVPMISQVSWDIRLRKLLVDVKVQAAPEDAGVRGEFLGHVAGFLGLRKNSRNWDAILIGKPFQEGDRVFFRACDLLAYLKRKNFRAYETNRVYSILKSYGGSEDGRRVAGVSIRLWTMPVPEDSGQDLAMPTSGRPNF